MAEQTNGEQFAVTWSPQRGTLNSDVAPEDISGGNLLVTGVDIGAYNVRNIGDNLAADYEFIIGNEYVFKPEDIQLQNKITRIYINADAGAVAYRLTFRNPVTTISSFAQGNITVNDIATTLQNIAYTSAISISDVLTAAGETFNISTSFTAGTNDGYIDLEITTIAGWDYTVDNASAPANYRAATFQTVQEAYSQNLIGDWNLIGSWYLQGELITWWTTQKNLPLALDIDTITNNGSGLFRIKTTVAHGLVSGEAVNIGGCVPVTVVPPTIINGQWIVTVVSADEVDLQGSVYPAAAITTLGTLTTDPQGIGELGRAVKNEQTGAWSYVRLIRAKALNWVTKHQQDTLCKKDALRKYYRYTDDYNPMGNLYDRTINYVNDCLLTFVDPRNTYTYENIGIESQFIQNNADFSFGFTTQDQSGGAILSGNSRFAVRLLTETLVPTTWSPLTNPVPASTALENGAPRLWQGTTAGTVTTKIDNFSLEGNGIVDLYKWAQIAVINYQGDAIAGYLLPKVLITSNSMALKWTNLTDVEDLDVGTVQEIAFGYKTALSIDELDGRIIYSNLTGSAAYDLTGWAESFTHSILRKEIDGIGIPFTGSLSVNEYELSENVYNNMGYMHNETYCFAMEAEFYDGGSSLAYPIQDITINTDATFPRRIVGLTDYNLTDATASVVYVPYVRFSNIDWNFLLPTGQRVGDVVRKLRIVRVDMDGTKIEVWSGIACLGSSRVSTAGTIAAPVGTMAFDVTYSGADLQGDFVLAEGNDFGAGAGYVPNSPYPHAYFGVSTRENFASIYCPDFLYGHSTWNPLSTDIIFDYDQPSTLAPFPINVGHTPADNMLENNIAEFAGDGATKTDRNVIAGTNIGFDSIGTISGQTYSKKYHGLLDGTGAYVYRGEFDGSFPASPVVNCNFTIGANVTANRGIRRVQVYSPITDKFGDPLNRKYVTTGAELSDQSVTTIDVFGGDVFTQKSWIRHRITINFTESVATFGVSGFGGGIGFYSQNRVNTQDNHRDVATYAYRYPYNITDGDWVNEYYTNNPSPDYNTGYNIRNQIQSYAAYNPDQSLVAADFPVRLIYGQKTQPEQASDNQRIFLPLDFTDLQYKDGEIVHHAIINSELYTWQPDCFDQLYFRSNTLISTNQGQEAIIGSGGAFTNRPNQLSQYGCPNKWLIGKGRSVGGKDVAYWLNPVLKCFLRHGGDGTTNQGIIHGMDSFIRNNTAILIGKDTPADGQGGHTIWNEKYKEEKITIRAWRDDISDWDSGSNYIVGDKVVSGTIGFEEVPQFYVSKTINSVKQPNLNPADWEAIAITNPLYYNIYTIVYSEIKNGFNMFQTPRPKIYAQYRNTYLSPRPVNNTGKMYEHNRGVKGIWYDTQEADAYFDATVNMPKNVDKTFISLWYTAAIAPNRVDMWTKETQTYLDKPDFKKESSITYTSTIKKDSTVTVSNPLGLNTLRTSRIFGNYIIIRSWFSRTDVYQSISSIVAKVRAQARLFNK